MKLYLKYIVLLSLFILNILKISAQTCCSAGAPITSSFDIQSTASKTLSFNLGYEYKSVNRLVDNNKILKNDPRKRNGHNLLLKTDFNLNKKWGFSLMLPLVIQSRETASQSENATGLGDLTFLSQYVVYSKKEYSIKFMGGIKIPTGQQYIRDDRAIVLSPDMQSGSGTVDFIGRIAFEKPHIFIQNLSNQTSFSYRYNSTNNHFGDPDKIAGRQFSFGNETQFTTAFNYSTLLGTWFLIPELGLRWRHSDPNQEQGINAPNSGGYWLNVPIGIQVRPDEKWSFRMYGEIPIYQNLNGLQITTDYSIGIQFHFNITT